MLYAGSLRHAASLATLARETELDSWQLRMSGMCVVPDGRRTFGFQQLERDGVHRRHRGPLDQPLGVRIGDA